MKAYVLCIYVFNDIHQVGLFRNPYLLVLKSQGVQALTSEIGRIGIGSTFARSGRLVIS